MKTILDVFSECYKEVEEQRIKHRQIRVHLPIIFYNSIKAIEAGQKPEEVLRYVLMYLYGQNLNLTECILKLEETRPIQKAEGKE